MSIKAKIQVDSSEVKKGLQEAENTAKKTGANIKDSMEKAGQGFESINKLGGTMGGTLKNVQEAIMGLLSPVGLVMAGITALGTLAVKVWDMMTVSAEEYAAKAAAISQKTKADIETVFKESEESNTYLDRLKELASIEELSNAMKIEAATLISILEKRYSDLGLSIDMATGKIKGLDEAQQRMLQRQLKIKTASAEANFSATRMEASAATEKVLGKRNVYGYFSPMGFGSPSSSKSVYLANKWNSSSLESKREVAWEMIKNATSDSEIKNWETLATTLDKMIAAQEELNLLREIGHKSEKAYIEELKNRSNDELAKASKKNIEEAKKLSEANDQKVAARNIKNSDDTTKLLTYDVFLSEFKNKKAEDLAEIEKINKELARLQKEKFEVEKLLPDFDIPELKNEYLKIGDEIIKLDKKRSDLALNQVKCESEILKYEELIAEIKKKNSDYYAVQKDSLNQEINLADMKLKGLDDEVAKQKLLYDIKSKGIMLDEKEVETIIKKQKELGALNLKQDLKGQAESLQIQAMKAAGKGKEAAQLEAIRNAEKIKGLKLTEKEIEQVKKLSDLQYELGAVFPSIQVGQGTITNELARRGGFASSVVTDTSLDVNSQILAVQKAQESLLKQIDAEIKKLGVIA